MIYRYDPRYSIAKCFVDSALRLNFGKLVFTGKENIPDDKPVIFAPNHRNALIDALLIVYIGKLKKQVVFLARADIFKNPFIAWILRGLRIIPVFRVRDGKDNLGKNNQVFDVAGKILKNNNHIALFPEARHNHKQSLLPIQKAVPRIVIPTEEQLDFRLNSQIVPVAIYYIDIFGFLSDCYVTFGEPIAVGDYKEVHRENPNLAVNQLRAQLEERLKGMVVNLWNDDFYDEYKHAIDWNAGALAKELFPDKRDGVLLATHHIVSKLDDLFRNNRPAFEAKVGGFEEARCILVSHGLRSTDNLLKPPSALSLAAGGLLLLLSSPLALFGFANGLFPILIYRKLAGMFKDRQFVPSVRYVTGLICVPVFDILQAVLVRVLTHDWLIALGYLVAMPATFLFAVHWRKHALSLLRGRRVHRFVKRYPAVWERVCRLIQL